MDSSRRLGADDGSHSSFMGHGPGDQQKIDELISQLRTVLDYYEWKLGQQEYLSGKVRKPTYLQ